MKDFLSKLKQNKIKIIKNIVYPLVSLLLLFFILLISPSGNPSLLLPDESIKLNLLLKTPFGTDIEEVVSFLNKKKWDIWYIDYEQGFFDQRVRGHKITGEKSIQVSLGDYLLGTANVTVLYGFNENGQLIDVWVWRTSDSF